MKVGDRNSHENLQAEVERLRTELTRRERDTKNQQRENGRQQRQIDGLQGQIERQKREIEQLRGQLAAARRAGFRQAAPFAKDRPQGRGRRPGRRAGTQYGRKACRPRPARVDQTLEAPVPTACPDCGGSVEVTHVASQYQEEIPEVRPVVRRFDIEVGRCSQCRRRVQGRHALQTSDALGAAGAQLGPGVVALVTGQIRPFVDTANPAISGVPRRHLSSTSRARVRARMSEFPDTRAARPITAL